MKFRETNSNERACSLPKMFRQHCHFFAPEKQLWKTVFIHNKSLIWYSVDVGNLFLFCAEWKVCLNWQRNVSYKSNNCICSLRGDSTFQVVYTVGFPIYSFKRLHVVPQPSTSLLKGDMWLLWHRLCAFPDNRTTCIMGQTVDPITSFTRHWKS